MYDYKYGNDIKNVCRTVLKLNTNINNPLVNTRLAKNCMLLSGIKIYILVQKRYSC